MSKRATALYVVGVLGFGFVLNLLVIAILAASAGG